MSYLSLILCVLAMSCLIACASPKEQPFTPATQPPALHETLVTVGDRAQLALTRWLPEGTPKAIVIGIHGFNDYNHSYAPLGEYLSRRGIAMVVLLHLAYGRDETT